jgi:phosphomannomutase
MVNFSVIGRGATYDERQDYVEYDRGCNERRTLSKKIRDRFPELESQLGGDTGLDIFPKGKNKGQIAKTIEPFVFFGDKVEAGGNDYDIARKAKTMHAVKSWEDTRNILQNLYNY